MSQKLKAKTAFWSSGVYLLGIDKDAVLFIQVYHITDYLKVKAPFGDITKLYAGMPMPVNKLIGIRGKFLAEKFQWKCTDIRFNSCLLPLNNPQLLKVCSQCPLYFSKYRALYSRGEYPVFSRKHFPKWLI